MPAFVDAARVLVPASSSLARIALAACALVIGNDGVQQLRYVVHVPANLAMGARPAVTDLKADLARLGGSKVIEAALPAPPCQPGEIHVLVLGDQHDEQGRLRPTPLPAQAYTIDEQRCGSGHRVVLSGGSRLSGQWAVYDFLEHLGVRYFHPEQTLYPPAPMWPAAPLAVHAEPAFQRRSIHVHRDHPVELSAPLKPGLTLSMADLQRHWIDWNVKLRQTSVDGFDADLVGAYPYERGFPREASLNLLNGQQGGHPILNPDDPRPESAQIAAALDQLLRPAPPLPPVTTLTVQFNPSEFTTADEDATVARLGYVMDHMTRDHPGVAVFTIDHGTFQPPTPKRGVRFFDLSAFAPPGLGVKVHPLMFYDLDRPAAGVYGNPSFQPLLSFTMAQQKVRPIVYYPEASWWLTFDQAVPLYLAPVTLEARQHDIALLAPHLATRPDAASGVVGHHLFSSGQEWGYWQVDYCVAHMTFDRAVSHRACLDDFAAQLAGASTIQAVLRQVEARQIEDLRDPERLRLLVGSDDDVETASGLGIHFHPLPPPPAELLGWSDEAVATFRQQSLQPLTAMAEDYGRWAQQIEALLPQQSAAQAPWVREVRDGLQAFSLRAAHAVAVYEGALLARETSRATSDRDRLHGELARALSRARLLTAKAKTVVRRREDDYRYPAALTIAGGERGTPAALPNRTVYPYRYLSRTHRLYYWTRPDEQLAGLIRNVSGRGPQGAGLAGAQAVFPKGALRVESPPEARRLEGLLPGLEATLADDGAPFLELRPTGLANVSEPWRWERTGPRAGPADLPMALRSLGELTIRDAVVELDMAKPKTALARLTIRGRLKIDDIIALMVKTGGFESSGARAVLALTLGYTPAHLPAALPVVLKADGQSI